MKILFYNNETVNPNTLIKDLTYTGQADVNLLDEQNVLHPSFIMTGTYTGNYCYIPDFGRFYFMRETILNKSQKRFDMSFQGAPLFIGQGLDVLETLTLVVLKICISKSLFYKRNIKE